MLVRWGMPLLSVAGLWLMVATVAEMAKPVPPAEPARPPSEGGFVRTVAGVGLVEPRTENIIVGSPTAGVVTHVAVAVGARVKTGDPLFTLDDRAWKAEVAVRRGEVAAAEARLARLRAQPRTEDLPPARARLAAAEADLAGARSRLAKQQALPRPEELPPAEAALRAAEAELADAKDRWDLWSGLADKRAVSKDELNRRLFAVRTLEARVARSEAEVALLRAGAWKPDLTVAAAEVTAAEARVGQARSELSLLEAGAWKPDLDVAEAEVASAKARLAAADTELDRLTVRVPPVAGEVTVLRVNVRAGEFAPAGPTTEPLMVLGDTDVLHVRADVDESDAWRVRAGAKAVAVVRGNGKLKADLEFVRFEPQVLPKRSLTGAVSEKVDVRVLQVIYRLAGRRPAVFVGQQMDVFIEAAE